MDRLELFFSHLSLSARVFLAGRLCGTSDDHLSTITGHLHVVKNGTLKIIHNDGNHELVDEPTILLYPYPELHTFQSQGADIVCAHITVATGTCNPLRFVLPRVLQFPLGSFPEERGTIDLLFKEGFANKPGRQPAVDRLVEYLLIVLLRAAMEDKIIHNDILPALADPKLARALEAMYDKPERQWHLQELAAIAGMSRARFANHFVSVTGLTPFKYLANWRISVAQTLLRKGKPLKLIAAHVGYASAEALSRAFTHHVGKSPAAWMNDNACESLRRL